MRCPQGDPTTPERRDPSAAAGGEKDKYQYFLIFGDKYQYILFSGIVLGTNNINTAVHFDFLSFPQPSWRDGTRQVSPPGLLENDL